MTTSKTVDTAIKEMWARLASEAARHAVEHVPFGNMAKAEISMTYVEKWLKRAGATATRWRFRAP